MNVKIYVRSSPNPLEYASVKCLTTEGSLIRFVFEDGSSVWFPQTEVFKIKDSK